MRGARRLFNYLVPMLQDNKLKKKNRRRSGAGPDQRAKEERVALVAHSGRGTRVGWAIAFHPPRCHVT